jgi:hypothetical protein
MIKGTKLSSGFRSNSTSKIKIVNLSEQVVNEELSQGKIIGLRRWAF